MVPSDTSTPQANRRVSDSNFGMTTDPGYSSLLNRMGVFVFSPFFRRPDVSTASDVSTDTFEITFDYSLTQPAVATPGELTSVQVASPATVATSSVAGTPAPTAVVAPASSAPLATSQVAAASAPSAVAAKVFVPPTHVSAADSSVPPLCLGTAGATESSVGVEEPVDHSVAYVGGSVTSEPCSCSSTSCASSSVSPFSSVLPDDEEEEESVQSEEEEEEESLQSEDCAKSFIKVERTENFMFDVNSDEVAAAQAKEEKATDFSPSSYLMKVSKYDRLARGSDGYADQREEMTKGPKQPGRLGAANWAVVGTSSSGDRSKETELMAHLESDNEKLLSYQDHMNKYDFNQSQVPVPRGHITRVSSTNVHPSEFFDTQAKPINLSDSWCHNCKKNHHLDQCPVPHDQDRIRKHRKEFFAEKDARRAAGGTGSDRSGSGGGTGATIPRRDTAGNTPQFRMNESSGLIEFKCLKCKRLKGKAMWTNHTSKEHAKAMKNSNFCYWKENPNCPAGRMARQCAAKVEKESSATAANATSMDADKQKALWEKVNTLGTDSVEGKAAFNALRAAAARDFQ